MLWTNPTIWNNLKTCFWLQNSSYQGGEGVDVVRENHEVPFIGFLFHLHYKRPLSLKAHHHACLEEKSSLYLAGASRAGYRNKRRSSSIVHQKGTYLNAVADEGFCNWSKGIKVLPWTTSLENRALACIITSKVHNLGIKQCTNDMF